MVREPTTVSLLRTMVITYFLTPLLLGWIFGLSYLLDTPHISSQPAKG